MATEKFPGKEAAQQPAPVQMTFTQEELTGLVDFYNLVCNRARFDFNMPEAVKATNLLTNFKRHMEKVEAHILEVVRVTKARSESKE